MSNTHLVIFDIDGTLIDTRTFIAQSYIHVAKKYANLDYTPQTLPHYLTSGTLQQSYEQFLPFVPLSKAMREHEAFQAANLDLIAPYTGVGALLETLSSTHRIVALTNRQKTSAHVNMRRANIYHYFDLILTAEDVTEHKPLPEGVFRGMEHVGASVHTTHMVGDTAADIEAGRKAGVKTVGVTHGFATSKQMEDIAPDHIIHTLAELLPIVAATSA